MKIPQLYWGIIIMKEAKLKKESGKIFTKTRRNSRIKKNYNPLKVNYKIYKRGSELYMEETKVVLDELSKNLNWKNKIFIRIFPKTCIKLYRKGMVDCFKYYNKDGTF